MYRVLVGVHEGTLSGIDTYAEQVARASAAAGHDTTLITAHPDHVPALRSRLGPGIRVLDLGLPTSSDMVSLLVRLWPGLGLRRLESKISNLLDSLGESFTVAHLNHPGLAPVVHVYAERVCAGAWFYPHQLHGRVIETWRHTRGPLLRRLIIAGKAVSHYRNDARGYSACDCVFAPTPLLATQLSTQGIPAVVCPPPAQVSMTREPDQRLCPPARPRLLICCGDLSHPRKNVKAALRAIGVLARDGLLVDLELVGRNAAALQPEIDRLSAEINIELTGPLPSDEVHLRMRRADALLFPSLFEEWGYVAVESLLCGTPVVTFPVYPFASMFAPGFGSQARDNTVEAFADAVRQVLIAGRPANLAARAAERFGADAIGERLSVLWTSP